MNIKPGSVFSLTMLVVLAVTPLILGLGYALLYSLGIVGQLNSGFTFMHWQSLFQSGEAFQSIIYTIWLAVSSLLLSVFTGLLFAYFLKDSFVKGPLSYFLYIPLGFPGVVAAFFFFQFLSGAGFMPRLLLNLGFIDSITAMPALINDKYSIGIILTSYFLSCPIFILLYANMVKSERLDEFMRLAKTLGASKSQTFFKVFIPILLKQSFPTILIYFIFKLGTYEVPLLLGRSNPETISVMSVRKLQRFNLLDIPQGYAMAVMYTVVVTVCLAIIHFIRKHRNALDF